MPIPADVERWFNGFDILAEAHGMSRIECPIRVVEVLGVIGEPPHVRIVDGEKRFFKTYKAAERQRDRWAREGKTVLIQHGVTFWLTEDELPGQDREGSAGT